MKTIEMLENVRDFVISNRNTGTSTVVLGASMCSGAYVLCTTIYQKKNFMENGISIYRELHGLAKKPFLIDNLALLEIVNKSIEEIEKLNKIVKNLERKNGRSS